MVELEQCAFLLHSRPYQENSYLVDLLTEFDGKVTAVVYSGKSAKTSKAGLLQPFLPLRVVLKGRHGLKNLRRVEAAGKSYPLTGNCLFSGFYLNELLVRLLTEQMTCSALYLQYHASLTALAGNDPIEQTLRNFELALLDELGVSFDFSPIYQHQVATFNYVVEQGFVPVLEQSALPCYEGQYLQAIAENELASTPVMQTYKKLMRQVINALLGSKPLNSRKFFIK